LSALADYSQSGSITSDTAYLAAVGVGTPAQAFELQVDTGSSNLWVAGPGAFGTSQQVQHSTFTAASSSSFRQLSSQLVNLTYGSGTVQGIAGTDSSACYARILITHSLHSFSHRRTGLDDPAGCHRRSHPVLRLCVVHDYAMLLPGARHTVQRAFFDGILGMAFSSLSVTGQPTLFENLVSSGELTSPVFGLYLKRAADNATIIANPLPQSSTSAAQGLTDGGELVLGGYDSSLMTGALAFAPLLARSYWLVQMDAAFVNGRQIASSTIPAAIDSGTTLSLVPNAVARGIASALGGSMQTLPGTENLQSTFLVVPCSIDSFEIAFGFASNQCVGTSWL
jgi:hypothetical protein